MKLLAILLLSVILVSSTVLSVHALTSSEVKKKVTDAISRQVEGDWSHMKLVIIRESGQTRVTVYNTTQSKPPPVPPIPPTPNPTPNGTTTKVCLVGDLSGSTVPNLMKADGCNLKIGLGDLGYQSDLSYFKGLKFDKCVIGNHDAPEDGSSSIYQEALAYCGDHWSLKIGTSTLMIGLNTNGDVSSQISAFTAYVTQNPTVKTIIVVSHKNGHVFPNAHHPAEAASLYSQLEKLVPNLYEISGHNHNYAASSNGLWYISGAGGKSHYTCGTSTEWPVCDASHYGYLELTIDNKNGNTAATFIN